MAIHAEVIRPSGNDRLSDPRARGQRSGNLANLSVLGGLHLDCLRDVNETKLRFGLGARIRLQINVNWRAESVGQDHYAYAIAL
jgi:hypothetical protein